MDVYELIKIITNIRLTLQQQKSTKYKPVCNSLSQKLPLPERITLIQGSSISNNDNVFSYSQQQSWNQVQLKNSLILGLPFVGELYSRLMKSQNLQDGSYYCYCQQLIKESNAVTLIKCIPELAKNKKLNPNESIIQSICFEICSFITWSITKSQEIEFMRMIYGKIIVAAKHPLISINFPMKHISIIKLIKCDIQVDDDHNLSIYSGL